MATASPPAGPARSLVCLLTPRFSMASLNAVLEPVRVGNYIADEKVFRPALHSFDGARLIASNGMEVGCTPPPGRLDRGDVVVLFASWVGENYANPQTLSWLRLQARLGIRICAVESASFILARAGLLAGRTATVHWSYIAAFREQYPEIRLVEQLFTVDENIVTCAGGFSGVDMMLDLIGQSQDDHLAGEIADQLVHHPIRPANAPQRMTFGQGKSVLPPTVRAVIDLMEENIAEPLTVPELADKVGLSQRQLERRFSEATGLSVVRFGIWIRLQHARGLLISTKLGVRSVAIASGFNSMSHFAYAFKQQFGKRPSEYRLSWSDETDEPIWPGTMRRDTPDAAAMPARPPGPRPRP